MQAIWLLSINSLRKRKMQSSLIFILIFLSALLLSTSITVITNTESSFEDFHAKTTGSHELLLMEKGLHQPAAVHDWWAGQQRVQVTDLLAYRNISKVQYKNKEIPNMYLYMMQSPAQRQTVDRFIFAQGQEEEQPQPGTIWIPTSLAYGNGIAVGDQLTFQTGANKFTLKVSAIVVDIPFGAPFSNSARIWLNGADFGRELGSMPGETGFMMGIHFEQYQENMKLWKQFEDELGTPYLETHNNFEEISSFYLIISKIVGFIMVFLGIVMMLAALFTVGFTISDMILASYRTLGVLKSLGLTSFRLVGTFMLQYALLALIALVPGLLLSQGVSRLILSSALSNLKTNESELLMNGTASGFAVGTAIMAIVLCCVWFYARKAGAIKPAQAIRYGMSELDYSKAARDLATGKQPMARRFISVYLMIGIRSIVKNARGAVLMVFLTIVTSAVLTFGYGIITSVTSVKETSPQWGYDASHVLGIVFNQDRLNIKEMRRDLNSDPAVRTTAWSSKKTGFISADRETEAMNINVSILDGDYEEMGFALLEGRHPDYPNEAAIGVNVAKKYKKHTGDILEVYVDGKKHAYTVTGIYQSISGMSFSARIKAEGTAYAAGIDSIEVCYINLNDPAAAEPFAARLNKTYGDALTAYTQEVLLETVYKEAAGVLFKPMFIMGGLFILVTSLIIYSISRLHYRKERKTYGIYKSIGMPSYKIRLAVISAVGALSAVGSIVGILAGVYVLPFSLESLLSNYGIEELPLVLDWKGTAVLVLLSIFAAMFGAWRASRMIRSLTPRLLVTEQ